MEGKEAADWLPAQVARGGNPSDGPWFQLQGPLQRFHSRSLAQVLQGQRRAGSLQEH